MPPSPLVLSPALPSELLTYVLNHHAHPTTLIVCSTRSEFLECLNTSVPHQYTPGGEHTGESSSEPWTSQQDERHPSKSHPEDSLLSTPLYRLAISRHIRIVYTPTVTHLRAFLSIFLPQGSRVNEPPSYFQPAGRKPPHLLVYGMIELHRDTSEWSAQGLGSTAAALVETGHRLSWQLAVIEPRRHGNHAEFEDLLKEVLPMLSGGGRRVGADSDGGGWSGRTVDVGRVMRRWFQFQQELWNANAVEDESRDSPSVEVPHAIHQGESLN